MTGQHSKSLGALAAGLSVGNPRNLTGPTLLEGSMFHVYISALIAIDLMLLGAIAAMVVVG